LGGGEGALFFDFEDFESFEEVEGIGVCSEGVEGGELALSFDLDFVEVLAVRASNELSKSVRVISSELQELTFLGNGSLLL